MSRTSIWVLVKYEPNKNDNIECSIKFLHILHYKYRTAPCWSATYIGSYLLFYLCLSTFLGKEILKYRRSWEEKYSQNLGDYISITIHKISAVNSSKTNINAICDGWLLPLHLWSGRL